MSSKDRSVRSLQRLHMNASTARVLNLLMVYRRCGDTPEHREAPFFQNPVLNRCLIVKHRLRSNEYDMFDTPRSSATKVLIPIDHTDLKMGARFMFVGQSRFNELMEGALGIPFEPNSPDIRMLQLIDSIPSLDPFLLREQLRRAGLEPARCYFEVTEADVNRMFSFVQKEITPLVNMSCGNDASMTVYASRLVNKILSSEIDSDLDPLRQVLQLDEKQFDEGIFCWKAFLYYKWQLSELMPRLRDVIQEIGLKPLSALRLAHDRTSGAPAHKWFEINTVKPRTAGDSEIRSQIELTRTQVRRRVGMACQRVRATLDIYDDAYAELTNQGRAGPFRGFLLSAPSMFRELGERLAGIDHIVSFWRFRFPKDRLAMITPEELCDIFHDFENGLVFNEDVSVAA